MEPRSLIDPDLELVALVRCGAHLYGTATPASDLDLKGVYLPAAEEILLQRIRATVVTRASNAGTKSQAGEVEVELFSLDRYLALLAAGQTIALDMLFAPEDAMIEAPTPLWLALRREAPRLVTRRATSFVRYARRQAALFGIKGSRLAGARRVLELLEAVTVRYGGTARLSEILPQLEALTAHEEHVAILRLPTASGGELAHLDLGGRKVPLTASLDRARELARHVVASYGRRARESERNEGVDWKALSHAVRVGRQALELLETGGIRFPLASASHLLRIKRGEIPYAEVAREIERLVTEVEAAAARSSLPDEPDRAWIDRLVLATYGARVSAWMAERFSEGPRA